MEENGNGPVGEQNSAENGTDKPVPKPFKEQLYDKIPLTFRQLDVIVKVLFVLIVVVLIAGIVSGNR